MRFWGGRCVVWRQLVDEIARHSQPGKIQPDAYHDYAPLHLKAMNTPPMTALAAQPVMDSSRASGIITADAMSAADAAWHSPAR